MNNKKNVADFISSVANNNYKAADKALAAVVNEKLLQRIKQVDQKLARKK